MNQTSEDDDDDDKLWLLSPVGAEPIVFRWSLTVKSVKGDKKMFQQDPYDIIDTIRFVCEELPELKKSISAKSLDICDVMSFSSVKGLCDIYNQALNNIRQQHKVVNQFSSKKASTDLLRHILELCYNRAVIDPDTLNQYPPFSPEVYGETSFELVEQMIKSLGITAEDRFVDLGSGVGQVVLHVAAATSCSISVGIEKAHWPALYAKQMELEFIKWMNFYGKSYNKFSLERGNFLIENYAEIINSATIIFVNNFAFGPDVDHQLKLRFANLKEGARIISSKAFCPLNFHITNRNLGEMSYALCTDIGAIVTVKKLSPMRGKVSWTDKPVSYYLHTIDHSMLENFFTATKESAQKSAVGKRRERLGRPVNFSLNDSQGSDSCPSSSCGSTRTTTPITTPTYRKRAKKTSLRRRLHRMKLSRPVVEAEETVIAIKTDDDTCSSSLPASEVSSPGDRDKENEQSSGERQSVLVAPLRLRIRTGHHRRRSKRHQAAVAAAAETKKTLFRRRDHKAKMSAATMKLLDFFHKNVIDTTTGQGYSNNKSFNDAWLSHLAHNFSPQTPKSMLWSESQYSSNYRHDLSSTDQQANMCTKAADISHHKNPVLTTCVSLPGSVAPLIQTSTISTFDTTAKTQNKNLIVSMPVAQPSLPSFISPSLIPCVRSTVDPSAVTMSSSCETVTTGSSLPIPPSVSQDVLRALENLLESFRSQYITMLQVMQTEQYHQHLSREIQQQQATRARLQTHVSELQSEITNQLSVGIDSLHRRLSELGTSPAQLLSHPAVYSAEHDELHRCAVALLAVYQLHSHETESVLGANTLQFDNNCSVTPDSKVLVDQPCSKERQHESLPCHSPLVEPPDLSAFSSPQSLNRGIFVSDRSLNVTPRKPLFNENDSVESQYQTHMTGVSLRQARVCYKGSSHKQSFLATSNLSELNDIKTEREVVPVAMETDPEMPVLMAESVDNSIEADSSGLCVPEKDGTLLDYTKFTYKSVAKVSSLDVQHAACDMPIDLTSPLGRSRRAETKSLMSSNMKPYLSSPTYVTTASEVTAAPIYSPISSIGNTSPDHVIDETPSVSSTSSFLNHFVGYERDSLLHYDPRTLYWSGSLANNFASLPSNVDHSLSMLSDSGASSCRNHMYESRVPLCIDRPMPDVDHRFASYAQSIFNPRKDYMFNYESLPAQNILAANTDFSVTNGTAAKARTIDRLLPDIPHKSASQLSCRDFDNSTPARRRRSAAKSHINYLIENDMADTKARGVDDEERKVSPDSLRWQQQINSSFEALIKGAYMESGAEMPRTDGGESPASVSQSNCSVLLDIDWNLSSAVCSSSSVSGNSQSLRHFERRSDSRDSGLGHDVDRRFERHVSPAPPPITPFSPSALLVSHSPVHGLPSEHSACSPDKVFTNMDYNDDRLYDTLFKKKFNARQLAKKNEDQHLLGTNALPLCANQANVVASSQVIRGANECKANNDTMDTRLESPASRVKLFQLAGCCQGSFNVPGELCNSRDDSSPFREVLEKSLSSVNGMSSWSRALTCRSSNNTERRINQVPACNELMPSANNSFDHLNAGYVNLLSGYARRTSLHDSDFCIPAAHITSEQRETLSTSR